MPIISYSSFSYICFVVSDRYFQDSGSVAETESQVTPHRSFGSFSTTSRSHMQLEIPKHRRMELKQVLSFCLPHRWFRFALHSDHLIVEV